MLSISYLTHAKRHIAENQFWGKDARPCVSVNIMGKFCRDARPCVSTNHGIL